jgi:predicted RNase H-like nuclease (RuvC/YqgF family)
LKKEIATLKKENEKFEKQVAIWKENYGKLDKKHEELLGKPVSKPIEDAEAGHRVNTLQKLETIQDFRDKVFDLENKVAMLEKIVAVEKDPQIKKLKQDKEKLEIDIKAIKVIYQGQI